MELTPEYEERITEIIQSVLNDGRVGELFKARVIAEQIVAYNREISQE